MMRTSFLARTTLSARYLVNHKKPVVQMPSHKPPKYIYKIQYHPTAIPTFDQGYRDHHHQNPFDELGMNELEIFRFKYSGQWWYIGNMLPKILTILFPVWLVWIIRDEAQQRKKAGLQSISTWSHIPEFPNQSKIIGPEF